MGGRGRRGVLLASSAAQGFGWDVLYGVCGGGTAQLTE